jgi:hypothetical protein
MHALGSALAQRGQIEPILLKGLEPRPLRRRNR